ncbi:hypothetical protein KJ877_08850 [bacterium]|nr:hypothetical protein [bacterium]MBU1990805.1 hypothetical protein [bacterium]
MKSHTTTVVGKDLNITREDIFKIVKAQSIKPAMAAKIIDECIKVAKTFEEKARELELDVDTLEDCKIDIDSQIELLSRYNRKFLIWLGINLKQISTVGWNLSFFETFKIGL